MSAPDEPPGYFAPVKIVSQTQYGRRHNVRLCREGAPVDWDFWRKELAPADVIVSRIEYKVGETYFLYLTWLEPEAEESVEFWDRP